MHRVHAKDQHITHAVFVAEPAAPNLIAHLQRIFIKRTAGIVPGPGQVFFGILVVIAVGIHIHSPVFP